MPWTRLLKALDAAQRHNDKTRGLTFRDPDASTTTLVRDYLRVTRSGTLNDIIDAIDRDERSVRRVLKRLTTLGELDVTETYTRGPQASMRKTYHTREGAVWTNTLPE